MPKIDINKIFEELEKDKNKYEKDVEIFEESDFY